MNKRFLSQSALYAFASIAPIIVNLAVTPLVTRILGATSYGVVAISISLFQFGIVIFTLGLSAAITRQAIIGNPGPTGAVATVVSGACAAMALFLAALLSLPVWGPLLLPGSDTYILVSPLISCLGLSFLQNSQSFFRAEQRVVTFVAFALVASLVAPLVGVVLVLLVDGSAGLYVAGLAGTHLAVGIASLATCVRAVRPSFIRGEFQESIRLGLPTVPHQMAMSFLGLILVSLTSHAAGLESAGALQIGMLIGSAPLLLIGAFNNAWAPLIYRAAENLRESILTTTYRGFMFLTVLLVFGFAVLAPYVVQLVAGPIADSLPVTQVALIVALGAPFLTSYLANIHLVFLSGRTASLALTTPVAVCVAIAIVAVPNMFGIETDIRMLALALPIFQAVQWMVSMKLRGARSTIRVASLPLAPEFAVIICALVLTYFFGNNLGIVMVFVLFLLALLCCYRRPYIMEYLKSSRPRIDRR